MKNETADLTVARMLQAQADRILELEAERDTLFLTIVCLMIGIPFAYMLWYILT